MAIAIPGSNVQVVTQSALSVNGPTLASDYAYWKMNKQYSTSAIVEDDSPDGIFSSFTLNNAPDWSTTDGWLTASTAAGGSGKQRAATAAERAFLRTDTLSGSLFFSAWIQCPDAVNGGYMLSYGNKNSSPEDDWSIGYGSTKKIGAVYGATSVFASIAFIAGERLHVGIIIDCANGNLYLYQYGVQANTPEAFTKYTSGPPAQDDVGFLLQANTTTGTFEYGESSTVTTYEQLVSDMLVIRFEADESANFDSYMAALAASPRGILPAILDGK